MNQLEIGSSKFELKKMINSMIYPFFFVSIIWLIKLLEVGLEISFSNYGIRPLNFEGLTGIILAPLIHGSKPGAVFEHIISNSIPLIILGSALFYYYRDIALKVTMWSWIIGGIIVWFIGSSGTHIGASGLIYAWASFLFFSGVLRRITQLVALSLLVVFLYGSLTWGWGILPIDEGISYESHFGGGIMGLILAVAYRKQGPKSAPLPDWMYEEELSEQENDDESEENEQNERADLNPPFNYRNHT